jgi:hypothetical protein
VFGKRKVQVAVAQLSIDAHNIDPNHPIAPFDWQGSFVKSAPPGRATWVLKSGYVKIGMLNHPWDTMLQVWASLGSEKFAKLFFFICSMFCSFCFLVFHSFFALWYFLFKPFKVLAEHHLCKLLQLTNLK